MSPSLWTSGLWTQRGQHAGVNTEGTARRADVGQWSGVCPSLGPWTASVSCECRGSPPASPLGGRVSCPQCLSSVCTPGSQRAWSGDTKPLMPTWALVRPCPCCVASGTAAVDICGGDTGGPENGGRAGAECRRSPRCPGEETRPGGEDAQGDQGWGWRLRECMQVRSMCVHMRVPGCVCVRCTLLHF